MIFLWNTIKFGLVFIFLFSLMIINNKIYIDKLGYIAYKY